MDMQRSEMSRETVVKGKMERGRKRHSKGKGGEKAEQRGR